ncbi:MAG: nitrous oxide reductase accessory protein NosL [Dissulfurispiraceae bacterium]|jgi:nitrous oxide reductase accessory protein NosL
MTTRKDIGTGIGIGKGKGIGNNKQRFFLFFLLTLTYTYTFTFAYAQPAPVPAGEHCAECGMSIDRDSKFAAEAVDGKGGKLFFCDIGDMLHHFRKSINTIQSAYVRDFTTGTWIDGRKAWYVQNKKFLTPMFWGIAAFSTDAEAKKWGLPVDFDAAFGLAK